MTFTAKALTFEINLPDSRPVNGSNTISLSGYRASAFIDASGGIGTGTADIAIYGLPLSTMNDLSQIGRTWGSVPQYGIKVFAGDEGEAPSLVWQGDAMYAMADGQQPNMAFRIFGQPGYYGMISPAAPTSLQGAGDVATMMSSLASQMGFGFVNNGVRVKLSNPYHAGTPMAQAKEIAYAANIDMVVDRGVMFISPLGSPLPGDPVLISPETGMIGYPAFDSQSVMVRTLFNPAIQPLGAVQVQSSLTAACGTFQVMQISHALDCLMPGGRWETEVTGLITGT